MTTTTRRKPRTIADRQDAVIGDFMRRLELGRLVSVREYALIELALRKVIDTEVGMTSLHRLDGRV